MTDHEVKSSLSNENSAPNSSSAVKVSIIIPVYNVEKYLRQCLDSVVNQTLKDIEIICVNDGSTDNSLHILEEYADKDPRVRVLNQENMGSGVARNRAIKQATGEYIGFMDSDDYADLTMFEKLYEHAKLNDCEIVMCPMLIVKENGEEVNSSDLKSFYFYNLDCFDETFDNRIFNYRDTENFIFEVAVNAYNKIYKNSFVKKYNARFAEEGLIFQDNIFFYHTYLNASRMSLIREFLYYHRTHRPGSVQTERGKKQYDIIKIMNMIIELFKAYTDYDEIELLNRKINHINFRYYQVAEEYRAEFFRLIKEDYEEMNLEDDIIDTLHPEAKANYLLILKSDTYKEFELYKEKNKLSSRIHKLKNKIRQLEVQNENLTRSKNEMAGYLTTAGFVKYKTKNIINRLRKKI